MARRFARATATSRPRCACCSTRPSSATRSAASSRTRCIIVVSAVRFSADGLVVPRRGRADGQRLVRSWGRRCTGGRRPTATRSRAASGRARPARRALRGRPRRRLPPQFAPSRATSPRRSPMRPPGALQGPAARRSGTCSSFIAGVHEPMKRRASLAFSTLGSISTSTGSSRTQMATRSCSCSCAAATTRPTRSFRIRAISLPVAPEHRRAARVRRSSSMPTGRCIRRCVVASIRMYQRREAAFVPFAGTRNLSRSHFQSQDTIELGQPLDGPRGYESGFMGRLASVLGASRPIAFSRHTPLAFRGEAGAKPLANVALGPAGASRPPGRAPERAHRRDVPRHAARRAGERRLPPCARA